MGRVGPLPVEPDDGWATLTPERWIDTPPQTGLAVQR